MRFIAALWLLLCLPGAALAQGTYPTRPIKLVVPYSAGGIADLVARAVTPGMAAALGQPVVVENRAGAGGHIAASEVARGPADGYTLVLTTIAHNAAQSMYANLNYAPAKDLKPVVLLAESASVLVVNPSVPARTVAELVALARAEPGKLAYGSAGNGSALHMAGELFRQLSGTDITHVPYKGGAPALNDLLGGQIQLMFDTIPTALPYIKAGRLRALGVTTAKRTPSLPDVPTIAESGVPGYESVPWYTISAPAGTPDDVVKRLNEVSNEVLKLPALAPRWNDLGLTPLGGPPEAAAARNDIETRRWTKVIEAGGIKAQ
jgi:tripartite-type tricarboxylate transporter receptor subunit TctC